VSRQDSGQEALFRYVLRLGDTSLVLGQRLAEWVGHSPALEEDLGLANLSLDLIGQARLLLSYAGEIEGKQRDEDELAFFRDAPAFLNLALVEQPNGDLGCWSPRTRGWRVLPPRRSRRRAITSGSARVGWCGWEMGRKRATGGSRMR
jgi:1,2-phenylacetyl-CoA epoxidase catalytic subunit